MADVSHELRTPLTVIKGNVDLIRKFGSDDEALDSIKDEIDRLNRMVGDLLLLARAEAGRLPLSLAPVEMDTLLLEVFNEMRVLAGSKVTLKLLEIDQAQVSGDRDRLKQALINLIANAIHYTPAGGEVNLSLSKTSEWVLIVVRDTGPGIPKKICHTSLTVSIGEKNPAPVQRPPDLGWVCPSPIGLWICIRGVSTWNPQWESVPYSQSNYP